MPWGYIGAILELRRGYTGAILGLHRGYTGATLGLEWGHIGATKLRRAYAGLYLGYTGVRAGAIMGLHWIYRARLGLHWGPFLVNAAAPHVFRFGERDAYDNLSICICKYTYIHIYVQREIQHIYICMTRYAYGIYSV